MKKIFIILSIVTLFFSCTFEDPKEDTTRVISSEFDLFQSDFTKTTNNQYVCAIGPGAIKDSLRMNFNVVRGDIVNVFICFPEENDYWKVLPMRQYTTNYLTNKYNDFSYTIKEIASNREFKQIDIVITPQSATDIPFNINQKMYVRVSIIKSDNYTEF